MGNTSTWDGTPNKIISTVPSQTELLQFLCGTKRIVGRTKFCIHPKKEVAKIEKIGGTKNLKIKKILSLTPDLIVANKEENTREQIEALAELIPTWVSKVPSVEEAIILIRDLGAITSTIPRAELLVNEISQMVTIVSKSAKMKWRVLYLIWKDPFMSVGSDTFISDMLAMGGFQNVCYHCKRYPKLNIAEIKSLSPDIIFLSSEPYPFVEEHKREIQIQFKESRVFCVDGELLSWYGPRMLHGIPYLSKLQDLVSQ